MDTQTTQLLLSLAVIAAAGGAAFGGVKMALNGSVKRIERIESHITEVLQRLARLEGTHSE